VASLSRTTTAPAAVTGVPSRRRRLATVLALTAATGVALAGALVGTSPAHAADGDGWVRVGHLSPDTKAVDVTLTSLKGGQVVMDLDDVTYGQVSPYQALAAGTYVVSMTAADRPPTPSRSSRRTSRSTAASRSPPSPTDRTTTSRRRSSRTT